MTNTNRSANQPGSGRWFQFRLRTLLICTALIGVFVGWLRPEKSHSWVDKFGGSEYGGRVFKPRVWPRQIEINYQKHPNGNSWYFVYIMQIGRTERIRSTAARAIWIEDGRSHKPKENEVFGEE